MNLLQLEAEKMRQLRGQRISMIFQEPMTSLNPVYTVGNQLGEVLAIHRSMHGKAARQRMIELLELVKIPDPADKLSAYPHQLSGGMRQRVMIAMALACEPDILIADEPTTALDVTIQAQILDLLSELRQRLGMAILLITHDLGVVAEFCDRVMVMYGGKLVEKATVSDLFNDPKHPYTKGLLRSIPRLGQDLKRLPTIEGAVPALGGLPHGCPFQDRCPDVMAVCRQQEPELLPATGSERPVACFLYQGGRS